MADYLISFFFLSTFAAAVAAGVTAFWRSIEERQAVQAASVAATRRAEAAWKPYAGFARTTIAEADLREAGWSEAHIRGFLDEKFPSRKEIKLEELRPHMDDVLVRDVLDYRRTRFDAAERYQPIRHTWVSVDQLEREKALPHELRPLVCERERQSGRLILAGDLIPFVGRPIVRDLLEKRLAECGAKPLEH